MMLADKNTFKKFCIAITVLWLGLFAILPHFGLFIVTFLERGESDFVVPAFTLNNYLELLDPSFVRILWDSIKLSFLGTLVCLVVGYPFASYIARASAKIKPWLLLLIIIPFWTNSLIRSYAIVIILKFGGIASMVLQALGIIDHPVSFMYGNLAIFIGITYTFLPFMILPLYASLEKLDTRLLDAAKDLGAGSLRTFWHITLPLVMPGIVAGTMLVFLPSLCAFYIREILGGAKMMLIGNFIKNQFLIARNWPLGASASIILTLILGILIVIHLLVTKRASGKNKFLSEEGVEE